MRIIKKILVLITLTAVLLSIQPQRAIIQAQTLAGVSATYIRTTLITGIPTFLWSNWALDPVTGAMLLRNGLPYPDPGTGYYEFERMLNPAKTVIICMDCWRGMLDPELEAEFNDVAVNQIYPLMEAAADQGFTTVFLTNNPAQYSYNFGVNLNLAPIVWYHGGTVLYHQTYDMDNGTTFGNWLRARGIDTLIYVGFASNACVLGRREGMFSMQYQFSKIYAVPEAMAGVEYTALGDGTVHDASSLIISLQFEIMPLDGLVNALVP
ncbi:MAG: isochorismatase family protein [Anaerolineales bacterium]|nr:isochorismatase family protein [Anaerolineales bacterium]